MKKVLQKVLVFCLIIIIGTSLSGCSTKETSSGDAKYTIRLGAAQPPDHPMTTTMNKFKELAEKNSNGQIQVDVYPANQLGSQVQMNEGVKSGSVTMTYSSIAYMGGNFDPKYNALMLPFLVTQNNVADAWAALDGEIGKELAASMEKIGIKPMGYGPIGFRHITNSKRPIHSPADLSGIKIRLQPNNVHIDTFKALGANPVGMDFSEVYSALQQDVIDAQENPIDIIATNKFDEVQDYLTLSGHFFDYAGLWMNKDYFDKLPEDLQKVVTEASQEAVEYHRELYVEKEGSYLQQLKDKGMDVYKPTAEEIKQFQDNSKSVYDKFMSECEDTEFANRVFKALGIQ